MLHRPQRKSCANSKGSLPLTEGVNECKTKKNGEERLQSTSSSPPAVVNNLSSNVRMLVFAGSPSLHLKVLSLICLWLAITAVFNRMVEERSSLLAHKLPKATAGRRIAAQVVTDSNTARNDIHSSNATSKLQNLSHQSQEEEDFAAVRPSESIFTVAVQVEPSSIQYPLADVPQKMPDHLTQEPNVAEKIHWKPVEDKHYDSNKLIPPENNGKGDTPSSDNSISQHATVSEFHEDDGMAACLLMTDGNSHLLVEWIAYHYLTLPLRYLVIAIDPDSFTSPIHIIERWNQTYIDIRLWKDSDYMDQTHLAKRLRQRTITKTLNNKDKIRERLAQSDEDRYSTFVSKCNLYHKSNGRTWVAHLNTDEYIVLSSTIQGQPDNNNRYQKANFIQQKSDAVPLMSQNNVTVLQIMNQMAEDYRPQWSNTGCMVIDSILFGPREEENVGQIHNRRSKATNVAEIDIHKLITLRYKYHSKVIKNDSTNGEQQRGLINVSYQSQQRPSKLLCPLESYSPEGFADKPVKIHQYLGSREKYKRRPNEEKNRAWYDETVGLSSEEGPNNDIQSWIERFMRKMGVENSKYLLQGLGGDVTTTTPTVPIDTRCALIFFGIPRAFTTKIFPSIKRYILDVNPKCHVFVHSYNFTTVVNNLNVTVELDTSFKKYRQQMQEVQHDFFYELMLETVEDFHRQRNVTYFHHQFFPKPYHVKNRNIIDKMIYEWHSIESGWKLMEAYESKIFSRFERVGFFRLDSLYTHPIHITSSSLAVIPAMFYLQKEPTGINGRLFFGSRDIGEVWASERFNSVPDYLSWTGITRDTAYQHGMLSEDFLKYLLVDKWALGDIISLRKICIQRVRTTGKVMSTDCDVYGKSRSAEDETVRGVIVLGMHRSGTSLLSGLLVRGLSYHSPGKAIPANEQNPYGFFENVHVCRQNDVWLKEQGRTWDMIDMKTSPTNSSTIVRMFRPSYSCATNSCFKSNRRQQPSFRYFRHRNNALFYYNDPAITPWIMKDPRLCITLSLWLQVLNGAPPAIIFTYRSPMEVARSLAARSVNQVKKLADGLRLWIWYNRLALENSKGLCRIVTSNDIIMQNPIGEMRRISKELVRCGLPKRTINATAINSFFNKDFMHSSSSNVSNCVIPKYQSDLTDPQAKKAEEDMYTIAMKVYCDLQNGEAYKDGYKWPIL